MDIGLAGDAGCMLRELARLLPRNDDRSFLEQAQRGMQEWWHLMEERGTSTATPMRPQVPTWALSEALAPDAIVCRFADVSLAQWMALTPAPLVAENLRVGENVPRSLRKEKEPVMR